MQPSFFYAEAYYKFPIVEVIWPPLPRHLDEQESGPRDDGEELTSFVDLLWCWLSQHHRGDWAYVDKETEMANERALTHGGRLISRHPYDPLGADADKNYVEIITEADRSATRIILVGDLPEG